MLLRYFWCILASIQWKLGQDQDNNNKILQKIKWTKESNQQVENSEADEAFSLTAQVQAAHCDLSSQGCTGNTRTSATYCFNTRSFYWIECKTKWYFFTWYLRKRNIQVSDKLFELGKSKKTCLVARSLSSLKSFKTYILMLCQVEW